MTELDYLPCPVPHSQDPDRPRRPAPGALLCTGHIQQGRDILADLPDLDAQLAVIAAPTGMRSNGSRNADKPIPYHEKAADARTGTRNTLSAHARIIAAERGVQLPVIPESRRLTYGPACCQGRRHPSCASIVAERLADQITIVELACTFLARHHDWAVNQPWADEYALDLRDIAARARGLLSKRPAGEATRIPCPNPDGCDGMLIAPFRDAELLNRDAIDSVRLTCPVCGLFSGADQWLALARLSQDVTEGAACEDCQHPSCLTCRRVVLVTDQEAEIWTMSVGLRVSANTIRQWAHRGHLRRYELDGRTLFDLEQVGARLATRRDEAA